MEGHQQFFENNFWLRPARAIKHHRCVQADDADRLICNMTLFRSGHDLDLRWNFQHDLSRSSDNLFDASWQEEHDAGKRKFVQGLSQKFLQKKNSFRKNRLFWQFLPPRGKTVDGRLNMKVLLRRSVNRAMKCAFPGAVAVLVSELCVDLLKIVDIWPTNRRILPLMTSSELTFDLTKKVT